MQGFLDGQNADPNHSDSATPQGSAVQHVQTSLTPADALISFQNTVTATADNATGALLGTPRVYCDLATLPVVDSGIVS